jgi:hypothetical protein
LCGDIPLFCPSDTQFLTAPMSRSRTAVLVTHAAVKSCQSGPRRQQTKIRADQVVVGYARPQQRQGTHRSWCTCACGTGASVVSLSLSYALGGRRLTACQGAPQRHLRDVPVS